MFTRFSVLALSLAASANAVCNYSGTCVGDDCDIEFASCNWQFPETSYSDSGIPCGTVYGEDITCPAGGEPIASGLSGFSKEAVMAYQAEVQALLPIGANNQVNIPDVQQGAFLIEEEGQCINATFIDEGACFLNKVGMITWEASLFPGKGPEDYDDADRVTVLENANITAFFPNADSIFCNDAADVNCDGGNLAGFCTSTDPFLPLGATVQLLPYPGADTYEFPVGVYVAFFIAVDSFPDVSKGSVENLSLNQAFHFTTSQLNDETENNPMRDVVSLVQQEDFSVTLMGEEFDFSDFVLVTFEDNINEDYQDVVIILDFKIPVMVTPPPTGEPCVGGITNSCGDICCDPRCPSCGGCTVDCMAATEMANMANGVGEPVECCPGSIRESGFICSASTPFGCIIADVDECVDGNCSDN